MPNETIFEDEINLVKCLDELIAEKDFKLALKTLREVRETFSRYDEYMTKVGSLIT